MLLALRLFALCVAGLQGLVAAHILRRPAGPFRYAVATLLALNALAALRLALLGSAPSLVDRPMLLVDGATGPMLLACGLLALRFPDHDQRDRRGFLLLGGGLVWAMAIIALGGVSQWSFDHLFRPAFEWLHTVPALLGLALAGVAFARALARARSDRVSEAGLVALGFLPTLAENGSWAFDHLRTIAMRGFPVTLATAGRVASQAILVASAVVVLAMLLWPAGRNRGWRRIIAITSVAAGIAYFGFWDVQAAPGSARFFAVYLGTTTSFYVLRPIGVGLAYSRSRTLWTLYDLACFALLVVIGKGLSVLAMGTPADELRFADLVGMSVALLALPLLVVVPRRVLRVHHEGLDRPSSDELLGRFLVDHYRKHGPDATATKQQIEEATGITENNLAATIRRLERRLDPSASPGTFVAEKRVGVRGRKCYRLTAQGLRLLGPAPDPRT